MAGNKNSGRKRGDNYEYNHSFPSTTKNIKKQSECVAEESLLDVKLKKIQEETRTLKLKNEILLREYIPIVEVTSTVSTEYLRVRNKVLVLESKLPHVLAPITDPIEIKKIIQQEVAEVLLDLSADEKYSKEANEYNHSFPSISKKKEQTPECDGEESLSSARLKKIQEETRKLELKNAILLREYIPIVEVTSTVSTEYLRVRNKLLALESKLPHVLAPITDPIEIKKIIQQEVAEVLLELTADEKYSKEANESITTRTSTSI